jgi:XTP/dITP diphosphohydrolase
LTVGLYAPEVEPAESMTLAKKLYLASSNPGKLKEFLAIANVAAAGLTLELLPGFSQLPPYPEEAPTFAENAVGKGLHAAAIAGAAVCADDSGLVVPSLGGEPGVRSARYAREGATGPENIDKLLEALHGKTGEDRKAQFVCVLAVARPGRALAVITNYVDGEILEAPRGASGFGYDPVFYFPPLGKSFAELSSDEKNVHSHRGKAFRRLLDVLPGML